MKRHLSLVVLGCALIGSPIAFYFAPFTVTDYVHIWFSNHTFWGFSDGGTDFFLLASILGDGAEIEWIGNGIEQDVYVGNVTVMTLAEGICMWANDSFNAYHFPLVADGDLYYSDKLYFHVLDVNVSASKNGAERILIPYYNLVVLGTGGATLLVDPARKSYVYVDLNELDALLEIREEESYVFSISMNVLCEVSFLPLPFHTTSPGKAVQSVSIDFGYVNVSCVDADTLWRLSSFHIESYHFRYQFPLSSRHCLYGQYLL